MKYKLISEEYTDNFNQQLMTYIELGWKISDKKFEVSNGSHGRIFAILLERPKEKIQTKRGF